MSEAGSIVPPPPPPPPPPLPPSPNKFDVVGAFSRSFSGLSAENNLHRAARCGQRETIADILEGRMSVFSHFDEDQSQQEEEHDVIDLRNRLGCTALWLASSGGHLSSVELLISRGAALEAEDVKAQTPLFAAVKSNRVEVLRLLLRAGADPNGSLANVSSPLHLAARENFAEALRLLVEHGADVDGRSGLTQDPALTRGWSSTTPLHMTLVYRHYECFSALLVAGASLNAPSTENGSGSGTLLSAIFKYARHISYARLFVLCGGLLHVNRSQVLQLVERYRQVDDPSEERRDCVDYIARRSDEPLNLMQLSRIRIREIIGSRHFGHVQGLDIPSVLKGYLLLRCEG